MIERTLCIVKPDGMRRGLLGRILGELIGDGLEPIWLRTTTLSREQAEDVYVEHAGQDFFGAQVDFMCSGPSTVIVLEGDDCVVRLRALVMRLRESYATSRRENVMHASDGPVAACREVGIFLPTP